ncbi:hypothetical protein BDR05DRAFT_959979 [Suillus weaverae]|nr:hypothetical protein BDR05DRAFT_959979 [Suillus weaverae]
MFALFDSSSLWNNLVMPIHPAGHRVACSRVPPSLAPPLSSVILHGVEMPASSATCRAHYLSLSQISCVSVCRY